MKCHLFAQGLFIEHASARRLAWSVRAEAGWSARGCRVGDWCSFWMLVL